MIDPKEKRKKYKWSTLARHMKDIFYATGGEGHCKDANSSKRLNPFIKLYYDQPIMLNDNDDVDNGAANGAVGKFRKVILAKGVSIDDLEVVCIDGYWIYCIDVTQLKGIVMDIEGIAQPLLVAPKNVTADIKFPFAFDGSITKQTPRRNVKIKFTTIPINIANARTVHKLQGKSLDNLVVLALE